MQKFKLFESIIVTFPLNNFTTVYRLHSLKCLDRSHSFPWIFQERHVCIIRLKLCLALFSEYG